MSETQAAIVRIGFGIVAIGIGLASLLTTPLFTLSHDLAIGLVLAGLGIGGINVAGTIAGARAAAVVRENARQAEYQRRVVQTVQTDAPKHRASRREPPAAL